MSTYIDQLRQSKDKPTVAYQEFTLATKKNKDSFYCFFEGNDNPYYIPRIKKFTQNIYPINCGGREKVIKVFELISHHDVYDKYLKAFFIDQDFNTPNTINHNLVFETPCYSIENLYVNKEVFEQILIHDFQLSKNDSCFETCLSLFNSRFNEYNSSVSLFNCWYACLIEVRNQKKLETGVQLDEKLPKDFITISLQSVTSNYDLDKILETFPKAIEIETEALDNKLKEFKEYNPDLTFRGKYQLEFLITLLQIIIDDSKKNKILIKDKINFAFDGALNQKRALSIFSAYAITPVSLNNFLEKHLVISA